MCGLKPEYAAYADWQQGMSVVTVDPKTGFFTSSNCCSCVMPDLSFVIRRGSIPRLTLTFHARWEDQGGRSRKKCRANEYARELAAQRKDKLKPEWINPTWEDELLDDEDWIITGPRPEPVGFGKKRVPFGDLEEAAEEDEGEDLEDELDDEDRDELEDED